MQISTYTQIHTHRLTIERSAAHYIISELILYHSVPLQIHHMDWPAVSLSRTSCSITGDQTDYEPRCPEFRGTQYLADQLRERRHFPLAFIVRRILFRTSNSTE